MSESKRDTADLIKEQYSYHAMSNKVEHGSRGRRTTNEPTGEVESLRGKKNIGKMGDRVVAAPTKKPSSKRADSKVGEEPAKKKSKKSQGMIWTSGPSSILDVPVTGYQPTTPGSQAAYESILTFLSGRAYLGNQATAVLRDAAQLVIETLKDETMKDPDKQVEVSKLLTGSPSKLAKEAFAKLVQFGKNLDDYAGNKTTADKSSDAVDEEMGVAVVFDESEDDRNTDSDEDVVADIAESSSEDEDDDDEEEEDGPVPQETAMDEDDKLVQGGEITNDDRTKKASSKEHNSNRVLSVHELDAHFLQRQLSKYIKDAEECASTSLEVLKILDVRHGNDVRECENKLLVLLGFEVFDLIKLLLNNRLKIWACVALKRASTDAERSQVEEVLLTKGNDEGKGIWDELHSTPQAQNWTRDRMRQATTSGEALPRSKKEDGVDDGGGGIKSISATGDAMDVDAGQDADEQHQELDLETLAFRDGSHTMSKKNCTLPESSWRVMKKGYEEVHVPALRNVAGAADELLIPISELPDWVQHGFQGVEKLNRIQSKVGPIALETSENILLCAPTGAGKTNVAMLTMLNILGQYHRDATDADEDDDKVKVPLELNRFKMVYIAPMKALVQEVVKNFGKRLQSYGVSVRELSGDSSLSRQQIADTQLLVTTPEKWDIVTRQGEGRAFTQLVKLVIIDEIHLLHDERGSVLESLVARILRQVETTADEPVRLVGLSATLPNYTDVATFLRVKPDRGLFFFDHSYRPVPLQMQYIGITERNAFKRIQLQNEICYEKAWLQYRNQNPILIFVHSRADTGKTAKALRDIALERQESFVREASASQEILREEAESSVKHADLKNVLPYGFAIHHAGMAKEDRELVEDLFADRHIACLVSTATLAWGVNLPAHLVIIKGTQVYDPAKGRWTELSPLDVLQMLGRAGRPQYDREGEGIILTQHSELTYYLSLTNLQLPVESQLIKTLANHLNAEVVLGTIQTIQEAADWLCYTFLYIRMLQNPKLYGIGNPKETLEDDPTLKRRRLDLAHTAATILEKSHMIRYERRSGSLQATPLGRVSSQYYISHSSMAQYSRYMRPNMSDIELLRLFAMSGEFAHITVREEEKLELTKLAARVPVPVKESPNEPSAKVNILLQAYISRLKLEGFALVSDMAFIQQSAARIMRALFEISLRRNWSGLAKLTLNFANMVANRIWRTQSPLRLFPNVPDVVARKLERKSDLEWSRYADLTPSDLGELVGVPKMGRVLYQLVHQFPRLELSANIQPITRAMLRVELSIVPAFQMDVSVHGYVQLFHVIVEDVNGEVVLHHELFSLKTRSAVDEEITLLFTVPVLDPLPPAYFIRVLADRWLHSEATLPISFRKTILPGKLPPPTELLDLQPLPPNVVGEPSLTRLFQNVKEFNPIQTQTFHELFKTDRNSLVCAPAGSGLKTLAEFAILRMLVSQPDGKCVYVAPREEIAAPVYFDWKERFGSILGPEQVVMLTGETAPDLRLLSQGKIVVSSVSSWDKMSRRWRQRKSIRRVTLVVFDELHFLGSDVGPAMEVVISRMRYVSSQLSSGDDGDGRKMRIVGLGASIANATEVGEWMGVPRKSLFHFSPKVRPIPLEIYFQSFDQSNYSARLMAMAKPVYNAVVRHGGGRPSLVFVPSRKQAQLTAIDLRTYHESQENSNFLDRNQQDMEDISARIKDLTLKQVVLAGIGFLHEGMADTDYDIVCRLYEDGVLKVVVCTVGLCWKVQCRAYLVVIMGTEQYDGRERRHVDYSIVNLLHIMGKASREGVDRNSKCVILCHQPKKEYLKKLLYDPLPVESHLDHYLHDHFNSEIVTKTIGNMQDAVDYITWTFLYRRLVKNPNYYGLQGTSNVHLSEHLSEMVETVLGDLEESKCCNMTEKGEVSPLNLGMIAAYYYIQYTTIELIASSITEKTKIRGVMEILAHASEYSTLPIRFGEEKALKIQARTLTHKLPQGAQFHDPNTKALILLQCHFSRKKLSSDLLSDQKKVVGESVGLIQAIVDVISSNGWLKPALAAMELSQMVVQGLWNKDHFLKQVPHFTDEIIARCDAYEDEPIESVFDILTLDDDVRNDLLRLPDGKMADVAVFCNNYPNVDVSFKVQDPDEVTTGDPFQILVTLERELDEDEMEGVDESQLGMVSAPLFPGEKREGWWIVVGDTSTNALLSLKRVNLQQKQNVVLECVAPEEAGDHTFKLFCMSDSYLGCDQEYDVPLNVAVGEDEDDDHSDSDDSL